MSTLYGSMQGERGEITRTGYKNLLAHIRGWNSGIKIEAKHTSEGKDEFYIYQTSGSNRRTNNILIGKIINNVFENLT